MVYIIKPAKYKNGMFKYEWEEDAYYNLLQWFESSTSHYRSNYHKLRRVWKEKIEMDIRHGLLPPHAINWNVDLIRL